MVWCGDVGAGDDDGALYVFMSFPDKGGDCSSARGADEEGGDVKSAAGQQPAAEERKGTNVPAS